MLQQLRERKADESDAKHYLLETFVFLPSVMYNLGNTETVILKFERQLLRDSIGLPSIFSPRTASILSKNGSSELPSTRLKGK